MTRAVLVVLAALSLSVAPAMAADDPPLVAPTSGPWKPDQIFAFGKKDEKEKEFRRALSGVACPDNVSGKRICLAVFDEGREARYLVLQGDGYTADAERVVLLEKHGEEGKVELDAEGAATDGRHYYVTGSHAVKRGGCKQNKHSRHVIRFRLDSATGRALREPTGVPDGKLAGYQETGALWTLMASMSGLKEHVGGCLGDALGVDIEGLAVKDGRLYFGFRGPADGGKTKILSVGADALFAGRDATPKLLTIIVGKGRGIRDLIAVKGGFLVLAGPNDKNKDAGWIIAFWDGEDDPGGVIKPKQLARLDLTRVTQQPSCDVEVKPEAIAVTDDTPGKPYRVVIFSDGMCDGGPLAFTIDR